MGIDSLYRREDKTMAYLIDPISDAIKKQFPHVVSWGKWNRRYISGTTTWSQHAWANAEDIADGYYNDRYDSPYLDQVYAWLIDQKRKGTVFGDGAKIGTVLWKVPAHHDHIHYERYPKLRGTPPLRPPTIDWENNNTMTYEEMQRALVDAGYDLGDYGPNGDGVDGKWGPMSHAALVKGLGAGVVDLSGLVTKDQHNAHRHAEGTTGSASPKLA